MQSEGAMSGFHSSLNDAGREFVEWMKKNDFHIHPHIELRYVNSYYGHCVYSNGVIKKGDILFGISHKNILSWGNSRLKKLFPGLRLPGWNNLILAMMFEEACPDSFWRPYLKILPDELDTPVFWTDEERSELRGTQVLDILGLSRISRDYVKFIEPLKDKLASLLKAKNFDGDDHFSFSKYKKFGSIIMAYSFTLESGEVVMVPMADMLNYKLGFNNARLFVKESIRGKDDDLQENNNSSDSASILIRKKKKLLGISNFLLKMKTTKEIGAGEEVFNIYGDLSDCDLLVKYGYVEGWNVNYWNDVDVSILKVMKVMGENSGLQKAELRKRFKCVRSNRLINLEGVFHFYMQNGNEDSVERGLTEDFVFLAKIFAANLGQWDDVEKSILDAKNQYDSTSIGEEGYQYLLEDKKLRDAMDEKLPAGICDSKVADLMKKVLKVRLNEYANPSLEDDIELLKSTCEPFDAKCDTTSRRKWASLMVRCGEKAILYQLLEKIQERFLVQM